MKDTDAVALIQEMEDAVFGVCGAWDEWHNENSKKPARLIIPLGEMHNEDVFGFLVAWKMTGELGIAPFCELDRMRAGISAQGAEGMFVVDTDLCTALLVYRALPRYRRKLIYDTDR